MSKLFFFDIDGTLIDCTKGLYHIPETTKNALNELKRTNNDVFLATGRSKCFILDSVMEYPFNGYVTCNGAYVEYKGETVYKKVISPEAIITTIKLCKERNLLFYFEGNDYIYVLDKNNTKHIQFRDEWGMKEKTIVDEFDPYQIETYIGMIVVNSKEDLQPVINTLSPYFNVQKHQKGLSFDLTGKDESKAKGIQKLIEHLGKDIQDTVAFGDGRNDIEMLSHVGLGIAMGNGAIETREVADYITDDVDKDGIMKALQHFQFINR